MEEEWRRKAELLPDQVAAHKDDLLVVSRGPPHPVLGISLAALGRVFYEFLDEDSFADAIEEEHDFTPTDADALLHAAPAGQAELGD